MSTNPERDDFPNLRRALALKRYEQPPPGYFQRFSSQVIVRVQAGERLREPSFMEWLVGEAVWVQRLRSLFETKPVLAGVFGLVACAVLVSGIVLSERVEPVTVSLMPVAGPAAVTRVFQGMGQPYSGVEAIPAAYSESGGVSDGQLRESLFRAPRGNAQLVSFPASN